MIGYFVITDDDAKRYLNARDGDEPIPLDEVRQLTGGDHPLDVSPITELRETLVNLRSTFPEVLQRRDPAGGQFEQEGCGFVHSHLAVFPPEVMADSGFWTWLTLAYFDDVVEWRFGVREGLATLENYGIGKPSEGMLFRMRLRGEIGKDETANDPYELARAGDQDLWRSHIIRQGYGGARELARSLLRLQSGKLSRQPLDVKGMRELAKRLRRLHSNVFLEILPASQSDALVLELCADL